MWFSVGPASLETCCSDVATLRSGYGSEHRRISWLQADREGRIIIKYVAMLSYGRRASFVALDDLLTVVPVVNEQSGYK